MWRPDLENLQAWGCPDGLRMKAYQAGMEKDWVRIHELADPGNSPSVDLFKGQFGSDAGVLVKRQCFLVKPEGEAIGTSTAWFHDEDPEGDWGRVHWVAVVPPCQGKGYSRILLSHTLFILRELGHTRVFLTTDPERVPAVNLYLRFGFRPWLGVEEADRRWAELLSSLKPDLVARLTDKS